MSKPKPTGPNERLREAVFAARMTPEQLARELDVSSKTVREWITKGRRPYPVHQFAVAVAIGVPEKELWPDPVRTHYPAPSPDLDIERAATAISRADADMVPTQRLDLESLDESLAGGQRTRETIQTSNRLKALMSWVDTTSPKQTEAGQRIREWMTHYDGAPIKERPAQAQPEPGRYRYSRSRGVERTR
ncbi:hypothetical protein [Nocardia rhamnosiphila]|uniref:HTH cro/C1-type domain-containing protein n=1 Tax=Nocardia rhamnosiphila TaxID=426716 RepID=A0ABV2X019_9NOCA